MRRTIAQWSGRMSMSALGVAGIDCFQHGTGVTDERQRSSVNQFCLLVVVGVCRDVAHRPITEPCLDVGDQSLFRRSAQQVAKISVVSLGGAGCIFLDLPAYHFDAEFVNELEVLYHTSDQRVLYRHGLSIQPMF